MTTEIKCYCGATLYSVLDRDICKTTYDYIPSKMHLESDRHKMFITAKIMGEVNRKRQEIYQLQSELNDLENELTKYYIEEDDPESESESEYEMEPVKKPSKKTVKETIKSVKKTTTESSPKRGRGRPRGTKIINKQL